MSSLKTTPPGGWPRGRGFLVVLESPSKLFSSAELERIRDRAVANVLVSDDCWQWQGADPWGYGQIRIRSGGQQRQVAAHRVVYEMVRGPIRKGRVLDHLCGNWACVRPSHLEPVTQSQNIARFLRLFDAEWPLCIRVKTGSPGGPPAGTVFRLARRMDDGGSPRTIEVKALCPDTHGEVRVYRLREAEVEIQRPMLRS